MEEVLETTFVVLEEENLEQYKVTLKGITQFEQNN